MKRLLWLGIGLAVGALVVRAVSRKAQSYTPTGIAAAVRDSSVNLLDSVRDFVDDVRDGMHEREQELHIALAEGELISDEFGPDAPDPNGPAQQPAPWRTPPEDTSQ
jgi:class 3 adenylate cyclase